MIWASDCCATAPPHRWVAAGPSACMSACYVWVSQGFGEAGLEHLLHLGEPLPLELLHVAQRDRQAPGDLRRAQSLHVGRDPVQHAEDGGVLLIQPGDRVPHPLAPGEPAHGLLGLAGVGEVGTPAGLILAPRVGIPANRGQGE